MRNRHTTLTRFYLYAFLSGMQFTWTTWLAYVVAHGGNPGWAEAAYHLAAWLGEVPTGIIADLLGRRMSMLIGLALGTAVPLLFFWIHDTFSASLTLALSSLAGTFLSGADTALLYETAEAIGGADLARRALARSSALQVGALAIAPAVAGLLYTWHDWAPAAARSCISALTLLVVWGMAEQRQPPAEEHRITVWQQTGDAMRVLRQNGSALALILFAWVYNTSFSMGSQYAQAYLPYIGLTAVGAGLTFAGSQSLSTGGSALAERLSGRASARLLRFAPLGMGLAFLGMGASIPAVGIALFLVAGAIDGLLWPIHQFQLNAVIPSAQRATLLSLQSLGFSLLMSLFFPAASYLSPVSRIYLVVGAFALLFAVCWLFWWPRQLNRKVIDRTQQQSRHA